MGLNQGLSVNTKHDLSRLRVGYVDARMLQLVAVVDRTASASCVVLFPLSMNGTVIVVAPTNAGRASSTVAPGRLNVQCRAIEVPARYSVTSVVPPPRGLLDRINLPEAVAAIPVGYPEGSLCGADAAVTSPDANNCHDLPALTLIHSSFAIKPAPGVPFARTQS